MKIVERDAAITALDGLLAAAVAGKGRVAVVTGAVATGKTELLTTFTDRVMDQNALAITATASRSEQNLPLGVLSQLLLDAPLVPAERQRAMNLLYEGVRSLEGMGGTQIDPQILHALCTILLELSQRYPLAVVVDDIDLSDRPSMLCLSYLARRVRFAPMLALFSHSEHGCPGESSLEVEALRQPPYGSHIALTALSADGVRRMAAARAGAEDAERFGPRWHRLSGGNPLLLTGLLEDHRQAMADGSVPDDAPPAGEHYARAVLSCLHRAGPRILQVGRGIAVGAEPRLLDQLLETEGVQVGQAVRALTAAGVLDHGAFRHACAREAVLAEIDEKERAGLHYRAAVLAHRDGAAVRVVADHLVGAGQVTEAWAVPVLEDAARQALCDGTVVAAVRYLKLAWQTCTDDQRRATIMATLVRAEWRINPSIPAGYLPELTAALHNGFLRGGDALVLTKALLWHGQFADAKAVFEHLSSAPDGHDQETLAELTTIRPLLRSTYPQLLPLLRPTVQQPPVTMSTVAASHRLEAVTALATVLTRRPSEQIFGAVERILRNTRLDDMSLDTVESTLLALIYGGRADRAAPWCDLFIEEAGTRRAPSRLARLAAVRAEISVRLGDLPSARRHARQALSVTPASSWGVAVGGPIAALVQAATATGDFDAVRDHLDQPVPQEMFHTRYGLHYLYARGRYSLAIGELPLALRDFERCGALITGWKLDVPGLIPWRTDAAETLLRMGRPGPARELIEEQLIHCGRDSPRVRGIALRLFAAAGQLRHRPMLLRQAAALLRGVDEYELARTLIDLTEAYRSLGESQRAGSTGRQARMAAEKSGAHPLLASLSREVGWDEGEPAAQPMNPAGCAATLSEAERRVAALAAAGSTNRQIAEKLNITISTVEQHLTRTYRKLNVTRRTDLPATLDRLRAAAGRR
jgi:DNA-binding CsgD family transcriptional regulator